MCFHCWEREGAPTDLPDNATYVVELIKDLYAQPDGAAGGPMHITTDDFNIDDDDVQFCLNEAQTKSDYSNKARALSVLIAEAFIDMTVPQRAAVLALESGWITEDGSRSRRTE